MSAPGLIFITHPEVIVAPDENVTEWRLSDQGRRRAASFVSSGALCDVSAVWSSDERKARETAAIIAKGLGLSFEVDARLGENDRSSTGYLPPDRFEDAADRFFERPTESHNGWERAVDAQRRILSVTEDIASRHGDGDLALVSHGAVGTLLWCALTGNRIDRMFDQPSQGHFWVADLPDLLPRSGWRSLD